jgi:hypothetical protein
MSRKTVLYLQLPSLDNETDGPRENVPLAGIYLQHALGRSTERALFEDVALVVAIQFEEPRLLGPVEPVRQNDQNLQLLPFHGFQTRPECPKA